MFDEPGRERGIRERLAIVLVALITPFAGNVTADAESIASASLANDATAQDSAAGVPSLALLSRLNVQLAQGQLAQVEAEFAQVEPLLDDPLLEQRYRWLALAGRIAAEHGDAKQSLALLRRAEFAAAEAGVPAGVAQQITIDRLRAQLDSATLKGFESGLQAVQGEALRARDHRARSQSLLQLGELRLRAVRELAFPAAYARPALELFDRVIASASSQDSIVEHAHGYSGAAHELLGDYPAATRASRRALTVALSGGSTGSAYLWEWQLGRIYLAQGDTRSSRAAYARSVSLLKQVADGIPQGKRGVFENLIRPVYVGYADLLLRRDEISPKASASRIKPPLREVRNLLESLKKAEVEDYFSNQCLTERKNTGDRRFAGVGVLYPIIFADRIEILLEFGGRLEQFTTSIDARRVNARIRLLRNTIQNARTENDYMVPARELYDWIIRPVAATLQTQNIDTIVFVPDGALRTVPLGVLHDGARHLLEAFAIATTPAIDLTTHSVATAPSPDRLLLGGVSEGVQGFDALPNVPRELQLVGAARQGTVFTDEDFSLETVSSELSNVQYNVAHFATHGEFLDNANDSFLLTYDDRLTMGGLRRLLERREDEAPLDLLVLSACQTAAGSERAALGLAGVAIQSGARSALASLWRISDAATAELMSTFYARWSGAALSKSESLRQAQLELMRHPDYTHPTYWAPYLMIGDWL